MPHTQISKEKVDQVLFRFLQSIYLFEKREGSLFGVSWDEVYLMQLLIRNHQLSVSEIAKMLKTPDFVASRVITKLEKQELVLRQRSSEDRRVVYVEITPLGRQKISEIEQYNYDIVIASLDKLSTGDVQVLLNSIEGLDELLGLC